MLHGFSKQLQYFHVSSAIFVWSFLDFRDFAKSAVFQGFWNFPKVSDFVKLAFFASFSDSPNLEKDRFFAFSHFPYILG